jgi:hypothetical protein
LQNKLLGAPSRSPLVIKQIGEGKMQAITTTFYPVTNHRGNRIKAECAARIIWFDWVDALNAPENHRLAAKTLATELGWNYGLWVGGTTADGVNVWVCAEPKSDAFEV